MIQCTQCFEWNHFRCLEKQITKSPQKPDCQFKCSQCNQFSVRKKKSKYVAQTVTVSDKIGTRYKTFISLSPYTHGYMRKQNAVIILKFDYRCMWDAGIRAQIVSAVYTLELFERSCWKNWGIHVTSKKSNFQFQLPISRTSKLER